MRDPLSGSGKPLQEAPGIIYRCHQAREEGRGIPGFQGFSGLKTPLGESPVHGGVPGERGHPEPLGFGVGIYPCWVKIPILELLGRRWDRSPSVLRFWGGFLRVLVLYPAFLLGEQLCPGVQIPEFWPQNPQRGVG